MRVWTVVSLTKELQRSFERFYPRIEVEGEVGQLNTPRSGHCYFQLREGDTVLSGVVWRSDWKNSHFKPKVGERVRCRGRLGLFSSRVQLYAHHLEPAGMGELARQIQERTERLRADGLLDPGRKRPLPRFPRIIGVATSADGAAIADFLRVSRERYPAAQIVLSPCIVQGPTAPASVIRALELLETYGKCDVVVVTRGGGSKDDLLAFMDETLARAIAAFPVPVVSAVGHEIDTSIADLVADVVAATPSAAALTVLPDAMELAAHIDGFAERMDRVLTRRVARDRERVESLIRRLRHPAERLRHSRERRDELEGRLHRALRSQVERARRRQGELSRRLQSVSPLEVLGRGYAVVQRLDGTVLQRAEGASVGDMLTVRLGKGILRVRVETADPE